MKADGIWSNIFRLSTRKESLAEILQNIPLFQELNTKELKILERLVHIRTYQPGESVFVETEPGAGMYIIRSGRVDIVLNNKNESALILAELEPGDFFGEMALLGRYIEIRNGTGSRTIGADRILSSRFGRDHQHSPFNGRKNQLGAGQSDG